MNFKGVIFDLDGTLVNSIEDLADSMNKVLERNNFPVHETQAYKYFVGNGLKNLVKAALPESHRNVTDIDHCFALMVDTYSNNCFNETTVYEGIPDLLDALVLRDLKLAVFSNKADDLTKKIVQALLPHWNFEAVIGFSTEALKKPNPQIPGQISNTMGLDAENVLYIGDSGVDMQTANNAGMHAVGALWGFRTKDELAVNGAKYFLNKPMDLLNIL